MSNRDFCAMDEKQHNQESGNGKHTHTHNPKQQHHNHLSSLHPVPVARTLVALVALASKLSDVDGVSCRSTAAPRCTTRPPCLSWAGVCGERASFKALLPLLPADASRWMRRRIEPTLPLLLL